MDELNNQNGEDQGYRTITLSATFGNDSEDIYSVTYHLDNVETLAWEYSSYIEYILREKSKKDNKLNKLLDAYINIQFLNS